MLTEGFSQTEHETQVIATSNHSRRALWYYFQILIIMVAKIIFIDLTHSPTLEKKMLKYDS